MNKLLDNDSLTLQVKNALSEDIGSGDLTAALIPSDQQATATVLVRESAILCGQDWFNAAFKQLDDTLTINWHQQDGDRLIADQTICHLQGNARALLTGERTALNFLQSLSATATLTQQYVNAVSGLNTRILDTRKTIPGLRLAQKYAVSCGGGQNHRVGLFDAVLIKENHIMAAGSITAAVTLAKQQVDKSILIEVEVETLDQLKEALSVGIDRVLLDNMDLPMLSEAVKINKGMAKLEASGNITLGNIRNVATTGVDFISVGALTKNIKATDYSMLIEVET